MKNLSKSVALALSTLPLLLYGAYKNNFNTPKRDWGTWKSAKMVATFAHDAKEGAAAPGSLAIAIGTGGPAKNSTAYTNHFPGYAGRKYRASVMIKAVGLSPQATVSMTFQGKSFKQLFLGTKSIGARKTGKELSDGKWHKLEYVLDIPTTGKWANTAWVLCCLGVNNAGAGKVYFDDFSFEDESIPVKNKLAVGKTSAPVVLVDNGKAVSTIVIPDSPLPVYKLAAEELQYHIKRASGVELPVFAESKLPAGDGVKIYLGPTKKTAAVGIDCTALAPSGYQVCSVGKDLFIAGRDRSYWGSVGSNWNADWQGTLYGVYAFLRKEMGVTWLFPGEKGVVAPAKKTIKFSGTNLSGKPKLLSAELLKGGYPWIGWQKPGTAEKFFENQARFLLRHGMQSVENMNYSHNFGSYWRRFNKSHPEYFALVNPGNRKLLKGDSTGFQTPMCISNPGFQDQAIRDWAYRSAKAAMARPYLSVMLNDTPEMCTCEGCRAWDYPDPRFKTSDYWGKGQVLEYRQRWRLSTSSWGEENADGRGQPSLTDRYARFCLAMQEKARKIDPNAVLIGYAYTNYVRPPREVKLNSGIIIQNVFGLWYPYTAEMSKNFRANWSGWNKAGVRQMYRPNLLHAGGHLPIFYGRRFAEDFRWAYKNGMTASYMDSLTGAWAAQNPNLYIICRMHENPDLSCDEIINEYVATFGKAADVIRKYIAFWEKRGNELTTEQNDKFKRENKYKGIPGGTFQNYALIAHEISPLPVLAEARKMLSDARDLVKDDAAITGRIDYLEKGLIDAENIVKTRLAQIEMQKKATPETRAKFKAAFAELQKFRAECEEEGVLNCGTAGLRELFGCGWPWKDNRKWNKKK